MFRAASTAPAPSPYGTAKTASTGKLSAKKKPMSAAAVRKTLITVTARVPSLLISLSDNRLDNTVPPDIIMDTTPRNETGTFSSPRIAGQADPSRESGSPRLIKAI